MDGQLLLQISRSATKNLFWFTSIYRFSPVICSYFFLSHKFNDRVTQYLKMIIFLITNRSHRDSACMPLVSTCLAWFERASRAHTQQNMEVRQQNREHRARGLDSKSGLLVTHSLDDPKGARDGQLSLVFFFRKLFIPCLLWSGVTSLPLSVWTSKLKTVEMSVFMTFPIMYLKDIISFSPDVFTMDKFRWFGVDWHRQRWKDSETGWSIYSADTISTTDGWVTDRKGMVHLLGRYDQYHRWVSYR